MKKPFAAAVGALVPVILLLGACSDSGAGAPDEPASTPVATETATAEPDPASEQPADDVDDADDASPDAEEPQSEPDAPLASRGTVEVAGTTYQITELRRCDPFEVEMFDVELELQGSGEHDGQRVQIDVYVQKIAGQQSDDVSWAGPEGVFGGPQDASVNYDGNTVSGSATLVDGLTQEEELPVSFDLEVPSEILDCR